MNEWLQILAIVWCVILFPAGGTTVRDSEDEAKKIGGQKWLRRFVMSIGLGALALLYVTWWAALGYTVVLTVFLHLGYGDRASWWYKTFIFIGYSAASLLFGYSWWLLVTPCVCLTMFFLSNFKLTAKSFPWKIVESGFGFLIAAAYVAAILNKWRFV